jgi:hypothetical protein
MLWEQALYTGTNPEKGKPATCPFLGFKKFLIRVG